MANEYEIFEFLEADNADENSTRKLRRRRFRDECDPFTIDDEEFVKRYSLTKELARPMMKRPTKSTDLSVETKRSQSTAAADVEESQFVLEPSPSTSRVDPPKEIPLEENPQDISPQLSVPVAANRNRSPTLSPQPTSTATAAVRSPRRRRRRREHPMTREAARRALVQSSQQRADAAVRNSATLERIEQGIASMQETWLRMESTINAVFARAPEQEHSG